VFPLTHVISLILLSLRVMPRVFTTLHLHVTYIDDITKPIAIYNDTHKFAAYLYSTLHEFAVDNKVIVSSHPEAVRKLHGWCTYFDRILKKSASLLTSCIPMGS